ncbi:MAG: porphobilinogen synthase, partial [Oricola sp.]|nr:porphobilinogen synthase [Oricola sp.]
MNKAPLARFPALRLRRPRLADWSRRLHAETRLTADDLIWAVILKDGKGVREPVASMPGVSRLSPDEAVNAAREARDLGIPALALFPYTDADARTAQGEEAVNPENLMCRAARAIKAEVPEIGLMADVALDPYTDHGHDGLMREGEILNDETVEILVQQSVVQARAGFDIIAPSDMMD